MANVEHINHLASKRGFWSSYIHNKVGSVGSPPPPAIIVMNGLRISSVMSILVIKYEQDKKMSLVMQH